MNISERSTVNSVRNTYLQLGLNPPKELADALARLDKLNERARQLGALPAGDDLGNAVSAALLDDRDPAGDYDVQRILAAQALAAHHGLPDAVTAAAVDGIRNACATHLDDIVNDWRAPFDRAAADLAAAYQRIGNLDLDDTTTILAKGGDIAEVWATARTAAGTIDTVLNGWHALMMLMNVTLDPRHRALRLAALGLEQYRSLPAKTSAWDLLRSGVTLNLPSLDEYRRRIANIEREQADETAAGLNVARDRSKTIDVEWVRRVDAARAATVQ